MFDYIDLAYFSSFFEKDYVFTSKEFEIFEIGRRFTIGKRTNFPDFPSQERLGYCYTTELIFLIR
jgi:hypothetical protein